MSALTLGNVVPSLIRTYVPVAIGSLLSLLVTLGVIPTPLPDDQEAALVTGIVAITIGLYYTALRLAEQRWPKIGLLLGSSQQPVDYAPGADVTQGRVQGTYVGRHRDLPDGQVHYRGEPRA